MKLVVCPECTTAEERRRGEEGARGLQGVMKHTTGKQADFGSGVGGEVTRSWQACDASPPPGLGHRLLMEQDPQCHHWQRGRGQGGYGSRQVNPTTSLVVAVSSSSSAPRRPGTLAVVSMACGG